MANCTTRLCLFAALSVPLLTSKGNNPPGEGTPPPSFLSPHRESRQGDWPCWRGPGRDGISRQNGLLRRWPEGGPPLLWKRGGLGRGWSSPIVVGSTVFITGDIGSECVVFALGVTDGRTLWTAKNGRAWRRSYPGARACCAFARGKLYHLNAHGRLACLEASTGNELWSTNILERFGARSITWGLSECLLVDGDRVIVTPGGRKALMAALDAATGATVWTTPPLPGDHASHASPILFHFAGRRIISSCSSAHGFGVDADTGKLLYHVPLHNIYGVNVATPVYEGRKVYYVTPYAELGRQYELSPAGGGIKATHRWTVPLDTVTGCSILVGGGLYAAGYRRKKWWFSVDWETGAVCAELRELTTGCAIFAENKLYCVDERGTVALVQPAAKELRILSRFRLTEGRVRDAWAHPVLCRGRLYLRYHDTLWCHDVRRR